jgi:hypothetical protein
MTAAAADLLALADAFGAAPYGRDVEASMALLDERGALAA